MRHGGELELSEIHDDYINLRICGVCGQPHGPIALREPPSTQIQFCPCAVEFRFDPMRCWPGFDFNIAVELCYCCGQVPLRSGSKFSVWFCDACKEQVRLLNARLGQYAVAIGRHSMMGGFGLDGGAPPTDVVVFCEEWNGVLTSMKSLHHWKRRVVFDVVAERWDDPPGDVPIPDYLARCTPSEAETMRRFRDMMGYLSRPGGERMMN